jgi:hypothetical protein
METPERNALKDFLNLCIAFIVDEIVKIKVFENQIGKIRGYFEGINEVLIWGVKEGVILPPNEFTENLRKKIEELYEKFPELKDKSAIQLIAALRKAMKTFKDELEK